MPLTLSASDAGNIKLGAANVSFDGANFGLTKGGVEVVFETQTKEVTVDQFGDTVVSEYIRGRSCKVRVPIAESTLDRLAAVIPGSTVVSVTNVIKRIDVAHATGVELRALAKPLILHPANVLASDKTQDFNVPLAMTKGSFTYKYTIDEERVFLVEFTAYPDIATGKFYSIGDPAAVQTP